VGIIAPLTTGNNDQHDRQTKWLTSPRIDIAFQVLDKSLIH
jgi:hypothetical protein